MKFDSFLPLVQDLPIIESQNFVSWFSTRNALEVQFTRWVLRGKLVRLRRGLYLLNKPYRKIEPYEFYLASTLQRPSYVTLEKALEYHDLIPESVSRYTSVTTQKKARYETPLGLFDYRHVQPSLFWGYEAVTHREQTGFVASGEKALLDLIYFKHSKGGRDYFDSLRLQNLDQLDLKRLVTFARRFGKPWMLERAQELREYAVSSRRSEKSL